MADSLVNKLEKGRAEYAYNCVKEVINKGFEKEYKSYVKSLPQMILSNGLGQTLAFIQAKSEPDNAYQKIYERIAGREGKG